MPEFDFDFRKLAQQISAGGDFRRQPTADIRMGQVIGYDPNYQASTGKHSYPFVSIKLAGDDTPVHKTRFAEWYVPNIGDTVWCVVSGPDIWVMGSLAGAPKEVIGQLRSPVSILTSANFTDTEVFNTIATHNFSNVTLSTPYLPNRIYRVEANVSFTVRNTQGLLTSGISATNSGGSATVPSYTFSINPMTVQIDVDPADTPVNSTGVNVNGRLDQIQSMLAASGPLYISYYGFPEGTQIIGCNWGASTTVAGTTGTVPSGTTARVSPGAVWYDTTPNNYQVYFNYLYQDTNTTNQANSKYAKIPILQIDNTLPSQTANITTEPTIAVTNTGSNNAYSEVALGVIAPQGLSGAGSFVEIAKIDVTGSATNKAYTITGSKTFFEIPNQIVTPKSWNSANGGPRYTWQLALKMSGTGTSSGSFIVTNTTQQMFIYDCGVAS
jgi:hypothetical protein